MEFRDLKTQYQKLKEDINPAVERVMTKGNFIMGDPVKELEKELAEYVGVDHCISCGNGTDALQLSLMALGVKEGDAVFVPDFTFFASAEVISLVGATPVFVDVDQDTFNMDPQDLMEKIDQVLEEGSLHPKAVIAVDLFGLPANFSEIKKIAHHGGMVLIEDGAQGFGGEIDGRKACSFGDVATTSFFPAKPLGCYGDGGAVFTNDKYTAKLIDSYRVHGKGDNKYDNVRIGVNSRLDSIQAAILRVKLKAFREYECRDINKWAALYTEKLSSVVKTPVIPKGYVSSWAQYTLQLEGEEQRDALKEYLKEKGIPSMIYYPKAMHEQGAFEKVKGEDQDFPVTKQLCDCVLSLPMHPYLTEEDIEEVSSNIIEFFK